MKTLYSNTAHPGLVKWSCGIAMVVGIVLFVLYIKLEDDYRILLYMVAFSLFYSGMFTSFYKLRAYEVDEENDTITDYNKKKYPLRISNLTTATYKENKKGRYRSLFLHDAGTGSWISIHQRRWQNPILIAMCGSLTPFSGTGISPGWN